MSVFAKKVNNRNSQRAAGYSEEDLDELTKLIQDYNITYQQTKDDYEVVITIIEKKQRKVTINYIKRYNVSENYAKVIQKAANQYSQKDSYNLVMYKVF